ncbi:hypothetical protein [Tardiphaga sp. 839_C3_N1_4]|jgi:hypothetical protein|uniref:hypothetical protein n=1 Tax=Tardiphaga sp. 839_C3_N1_4 TaxID=3240761 RepID=UPI003F299C41
MTQNDPTDHALAAIASILDRKEAESQVAEHGDTEPASITVVTETVVTETVSVMVAAEPEAPLVEHESPSTVPEALEVDGYSRLGPGPLDAIRFRWTARRDDDGQYFVDETIGSSRPISSGPMPRDEIIDFIDGRERAARDRFETLKSQMTVGSSAPRYSDY